MPFFKKFLFTVVFFTALSGDALSFGGCVGFTVVCVSAGEADGSVVCVDAGGADCPAVGDRVGKGSCDPSPEI